MFETSEFLNEECTARCGLTPSSLAQLLNFVINSGLARIDALNSTLVFLFCFCLKRVLFSLFFEFTDSLGVIGDCAGQR